MGLGVRDALQRSSQSRGVEGRRLLCAHLTSRFLGFFPSMGTEGADELCAQATEKH